MTRTTAASLRWSLAADLIGLVRERPGLARAEALRALGVSTGTGADLIARLRSARLLAEGSPVAAGRGRPTAPLQPHPQGPVVLAADLHPVGWRLVAAGVDGVGVPFAAADHVRAAAGEVGASGLAVAHEPGAATSAAAGQPVASGFDLTTEEETVASLAVEAEPAASGSGLVAGDSGASGLASAGQPVASDPDVAAAGEPAASGLGAAEVIAPVAAAFAAARAAYGDRVVGASVSVAAAVREGRLIHTAEFDWHDVDFETLWPGAPFLLVENDATLGALAESRRGAAHDARASVHVMVMTGVGGGAVLRGRPVLGGGGAALEVGHLPLGDPGVRCRCGAYGCWDTVLGAAPLARRLGIDDRDLLAAVRDRWPHVGGDLADDAATTLGRGLAALTTLLDPDTITLAGLGPAIRAHGKAAFAAALDRGLMRGRRADPPRVLDGALADDAPLVGAIELALDRATTPEALAAWASRR